MPHDPARVEDTRGWLARADDDLKAAEHLLKPSPPHLRSTVSLSASGGESPEGIPSLA